MQQVTLRSKTTPKRQTITIEEAKRRQAAKQKSSTLPRSVTIKAPVATAQQVNTTRPKIQTLGNKTDGSIRVKHREYIGDITGTIPYNVVSYPINPGLSQTFPWLSTISTRFESYTFNSLSFEYRTMVSTSRDGRIMLAVDYDASDDPASDKMTLMNYHSSVENSVWTKVRLNCDKADLHKMAKQRYVRNTNPLPKADIKTLDVGNFLVATQAVSNPGSSIGDLFVEYDISLQTPQLPSVPEVADSSLSLTTLINSDIAGADLINLGPFQTTRDFSAPAYTIFYGRLPVKRIDKNSIVILQKGTYIVVAKCQAATGDSLFPSNSLTVGTGNSIAQIPGQLSYLPSSSFYNAFRLLINNTADDGALFWNPPAPTGGADNRWQGAFLNIAPYNDGNPPFPPYAPLQGSTFPQNN